MGRYDSREGGGRARQEQALESNAGCSCRMRKRGSAGGAEFDLFALNAGNDDLYRPLGKHAPRRGSGVEVFHQVDLHGLAGFAG